MSHTYTRGTQFSTTWGTAFQFGDTRRNFPGRRTVSHPSRKMVEGLCECVVRDENEIVLPPSRFATGGGWFGTGTGLWQQNSMAWGVFLCPALPEPLFSNGIEIADMNVAEISPAWSGTAPQSSSTTNWAWVGWVRFVRLTFRHVDIVPAGPRKLSRHSVTVFIIYEEENVSFVCNWCNAIKTAVHGGSGPPIYTFHLPVPHSHMGRIFPYPHTLRGRIAFNCFHFFLYVPPFFDHILPLSLPLSIFLQMEAL